MLTEVSGKDGSLDELSATRTKVHPGGNADRILRIARHPPASHCNLPERRIWTAMLRPEFEYCSFSTALTESAGGYCQYSDLIDIPKARGR
jgi:hypothetical protein